MKFSIYTTLLVVLIIIIAHITVTLKDWNSYKGYIAQKLETAYDAKIYIGGKVKFSLITPKVTIHNVYIQYDRNQEQQSPNLVHVDKIEIKPSLLARSLLPKSITLFSMKCNKTNLLHITNASTNIDFILKDSCININDHAVSIKELHLKKNEKFTGNIKINEHSYNFSGKVYNKKNNLHITVESNLIKLDFKGNKFQEKLNGKLVLIVNNHSDAASQLMKLLNFNLFSYFVPNENIHISSNVYMDTDEFSMTHLNISSSGIQANGIIHSDRKSHHTDIGVNLSKFTIKNNPNIDIKELLECFKRSIPKNLNLDFELTAPKIDSQESKILDNFSTAIKFADGQATVNILFKLPGANKLSSISGKVSSNNTLSEFDGELNAIGKDLKPFIQYLFPAMTMQENEENEFSVYSKLHLGPRVLSMSDITLFVSTQTNNEFLKGTIKLNYTKKHNIVRGRINAYNVNIDRYNNIIHPAQTKWLKNFKYDISIKTTINNLILNNEKIKNLDFLLEIKKHKLAATQVRIQGKNFDMNGSAQLLLEQKHTKPLLNIHFTGKEFNGNIMTVPSFIEHTNDPRQKIQWSTHKLDFLNNIEHFDANILIDAERFKFRKQNLQNFILDASITHSTATIRHAEYALENGKVLLQGYLRPNSINTEFIVSDLEITGIDKIIGKITVGGKIETYGEGIINLANNCSGEINIYAPTIKLSGLNLNGLIIKLLSKSKSDIIKFTQSDLYKDETIFSNIKGTIDMKNGICSIADLQFRLDQAAGSFAASLVLSNFTLHSKSVLFFRPENYNHDAQLEMDIEGPIWSPTIHCEIDKALSTLKQ